jgi:ABC-type uncharacterized transport system ATPase component
MNGKKCAMEYCDFWDHKKQICSLALESRRRSEIFRIILSKANKLALDAKDSEELMKLTQELIIVAGTKTLQ